MQFFQNQKGLFETTRQKTEGAAEPVIKILRTMKKQRKAMNTRL